MNPVIRPIVLLLALCVAAPHPAHALRVQAPAQSEKVKTGLEEALLPSGEFIRRYNAIPKISTEREVKPTAEEKAVRPTAEDRRKGIQSLREAARTVYLGNKLRVEGNYVQIDLPPPPDDVNGVRPTQVIYDETDGELYAYSSWGPETARKTGLTPVFTYRRDFELKAGGPFHQKLVSGRMVLLVPKTAAVQAGAEESKLYVPREEYYISAPVPLPGERQEGAAIPLADGGLAVITTRTNIHYLVKAEGSLLKVLRRGKFVVKQPNDLKGTLRILEYPDNWARPFLQGETVDIPGEEIRLTRTDGVHAGWTGTRYWSYKVQTLKEGDPRAAGAEEAYTLRDGSTADKMLVNGVMTYLTRLHQKYTLLFIAYAGWVFQEAEPSFSSADRARLTRYALMKPDGSLDETVGRIVRNALYREGIDLPWQLGSPVKPEESAAGAEEKIDPVVKQLLQRIYQLSEIKDQADYLAFNSSTLTAAQWAKLVEVLAGLRRHGNASAPRLFAWIAAHAEHRGLLKKMVEATMTSPEPWVGDAIQRLIESIPDQTAMAIAIEETAELVRPYAAKPRTPEGGIALGFLFGLDEFQRFRRPDQQWYLPQIQKHPKDWVLRTQHADLYDSWGGKYLVGGQPFQPYYSMFQFLASLETYKSGILKGDKTDSAYVRQVLELYQELNQHFGEMLMKDQPFMGSEEETLSMRLRMARPMAELLEMAGFGGKADHQAVTATIARAEERIRQLDQNLLATQEIASAGAEEQRQRPSVKDIGSLDQALEALKSSNSQKVTSGALWIRSNLEPMSLELKDRPGEVVEGLVDALWDRDYSSVIRRGSLVATLDALSYHAVFLQALVGSRGKIGEALRRSSNVKLKTRERWEGLIAFLETSPRNPRLSRAAAPAVELFQGLFKSGDPAQLADQARIGRLQTGDRKTIVVPVHLEKVAVNLPSAAQPPLGRLFAQPNAAVPSALAGLTRVELAADRAQAEQTLREQKAGPSDIAVLGPEVMADFGGWDQLFRSHELTGLVLSREALATLEALVRSNPAYLDAFLAGVHHSGGLTLIHSIEVDSGESRLYLYA